MNKKSTQKNSTWKQVKLHDIEWAHQYIDVEGRIATGIGITQEGINSGLDQFYFILKPLAKVLKDIVKNVSEQNKSKTQKPKEKEVEND